MEQLADLGWRVYPAVALLLAGALMAVPGLRRELAGLRASHSDRSKHLQMMTGFRMAIVGVSVMVFASAWIAGISWLMWLGAIIGIGELVESSMMISGMRMGEDLRRRQIRTGQHR